MVRISVLVWVIGWLQLSVFGAAQAAPPTRTPMIGLPTTLQSPQIAPAAFTGMPLKLAYQEIRNQEAPLKFREPAPGALPNYVKETLAEAYAKLGMAIEYVEMPRQRSLVEANQGRIDGELARIDSIGGEYKNLVRVDFPLYSFDIVLVADRRDCGVCNFSQIENLAFINGVRLVEDFLQQNSRGKAIAEANNIKQLLSLLENKRVEAAIMTDFEYQESGLADNRHYIKVPLERSLSYHYLHKNHADLADDLAAILEQMHDSGRIDALLQKHNVDLPRRIPPLTKQPMIRLIAGEWQGLTNRDGSGRYWRLMQAVFGDVAEELELNASSFHRANLSLAEQRYDIMLAAYSGQQPNNSIVSSTHFDYDVPVYIMTSDQETMAQVEAGTLKQPICYTQGYDYREFLPEGLVYYAAETPLDCFAMLDLGRVAAVVDYKENVPEWFDADLKRKALHPGLPLHLAFQNNERGRQLRAHYETRMRELVNSGEIEKIFSPAQLKKANLLHP